MFSALRIYGRLVLLAGFLLAGGLAAHAQAPGDGGSTGGPPDPTDQVPGNGGTTGGPPAPNTAPLPVQLVSFTAQAQGAAVALAWSTASELNATYFAVERSRDGQTFEQLGTVAAAGSSTTAHTYGFRDAQLSAGAATRYYRLRQVDFDGTFSYSPVRTVAVSGRPELALFPNPATRATALTGAQPGTVVTVFTVVGHQVTAATADAAGIASLVLPQGLATGIYLVRAGSKTLRLTVE